MCTQNCSFCEIGMAVSMMNCPKRITASAVPIVKVTSIEFESAPAPELSSPAEKILLDKVN